MDNEIRPKLREGLMWCSRDECPSFIKNETREECTAKHPGRIAHGAVLCDVFYDRKDAKKNWAMVDTGYLLDGSPQGRSS